MELAAQDRERVRVLAVHVERRPALGLEPRVGHDELGPVHQDPDARLPEVHEVLAFARHEARAAAQSCGISADRVAERTWRSPRRFIDHLNETGDFLGRDRPRQVFESTRVRSCGLWATKRSRSSSGSRVLTSFATRSMTFDRRCSGCQLVMGRRGLAERRDTCPHQAWRVCFRPAGLSCVWSTQRMAQVERRGRPRAHSAK